MAELPDDLQWLAGLGSAQPSTSGSDLALDAVLLGRRRLRRRRHELLVHRALGLAGAVAMVAAVIVVADHRPAPTTLAISCGSSGVLLQGSHVRTTAAGTSLHVTNTSGDVVRVQVGDTGVLVGPGQADVVLPVRPGTAAVSCGGAAARPISVSDPDHNFISGTESCSSGWSHSYGGEAPVDFGDPAAITRADFGKAGDVARVIGYRDASTRTVQVSREGTTVAIARWHALPVQGMWLLDDVQVCMTSTPA